MRTRFMLALAMVFLFSPCRAAVLTNYATADTYFETYGSEGKNFGSAPVLRMDQWGGRQVFLRFPLAGVPSARRIGSAKVALFITEVGFNEAGELPELKTCVGVYDVVTPWTEMGLSYRTADGERPWNQGPGIPGGKYSDVGPLPKFDIGEKLRQPSVAFEAVKAQKGRWLELDVTAHVREQAREEAKEINLLLRTGTMGRNYTFASRETQKKEQQPRLVITFDPNTRDVGLKPHLVTDWVAGRKVLVPTGTRVEAPGASAEIVRQPKTSRNKDFVAKVGYDLEGSRPTLTGVMLEPDVPGHYQVRLGRVGGNGTPSERAEPVDVHVLQVPKHPRFYVTAENLPKLRSLARGNSRIYGAFRDWVTAGSRGAAKGAFHDMGPNEGCENTSLLWLVSSNGAALTNAMLYADRILAKPMREHFGDVHEATFVGAAWVHALAVHYDWCYEQLTPERRKVIREWLKEAARWAWVRSSAPVAHNDGGARQCLLGSAALALLGDDPKAEELYRLTAENFDRNLLPWLNDGGQGGRSGDGGEYEGLHAFYIVKYAWMAQTATGEDVFSESPFFFNRINHILFGWYPRKLVEARGAFAMRQYYSPSGDHIRMGYVGDTQPYQSAAVLCARFRDTPEAQGLRWMGGEWPTRWMQYTLRWAVLGDWENVPTREPEALSFFDRGCNTMFLRSDWSDNATWILFENSPLVSAHGSLDSGTFEIFKGDLLAARTGNLDHANVGATHTMNYMHRTIAANSLLINDPTEKWKGFLGGAEGIHDGGGQRSNWPLTTSPEADTYGHYRHVFQRGQINRFADTKDFSYAAADLTPAYTSPYYHNGNLNKPKVERVSRELVYLRGLDTLLVFDRVRSMKPEFRKTWLLHSLGDLDVLDGREERVDEGESVHRNATRVMIRHGWPLPVPSFGRCLSVTLLPEQAEVRKIGGRVELEGGERASWPGDQWHGKHRHRHIKDFWVNGTNYPPGNPPETRWFGEPPSQAYVPGTPDESGGRGKWRLEVSPAQPALEDVFFHALAPRLGKEGGFPEITALRDVPGWHGVRVAEQGKTVVVFFSTTETGSERLVASQAKASEVLVIGLQPGKYRVGERTHEVGEDGVLWVKASGPELEVSPKP